MKTLIIPMILFSFSAQAKPEITVSGISSGAYMAQQIHTAFSSEISGAGIIAGGPFHCAKGAMITALNSCMKVFMGQPKVEESLATARKLAGSQIDSLDHLRGSKVYVLSGTKDETVLPKVSDVGVDFYRQLGAVVHYENSLAVGHAFPTESFGNACETASQPPFISKCGRDIAGEILEHLHGPLLPKVPELEKSYRRFVQLSADLSKEDQDKLSLAQMGYAYVPSACEGNPDCRIHVSFHGCKQTTEDLQLTFVKQTGFNSWAESNSMIILYPQARKSMPQNPNGCWDWWGYTGANYHTKSAPQARVIMGLVEALRKGRLKLEPLL